LKNFTVPFVFVLIVNCVDNKLSGKYTVDLADIAKS